MTRRRSPGTIGGSSSWSALSSSWDALLALILLPVLIGVAIALVVTAYRLARYLDAGVPVLWGVAMFIPCVNILVLLVLSSKAQTWCRRYGIKVGFFGPTQESIEEVRRRGVRAALSTKFGRQEPWFELA